jgi:hypothetical protein
MQNLKRKLFGLIQRLKQDKQIKQLARKYRKLYRQMKQALCEQQGKIKQLDGEELDRAQTEMWDMSSNYYYGLREIINSVPEAHIKRFWQYT